MLRILCLILTSAAHFKYNRCVVSRAAVRRTADKEPLMTESIIELDVHGMTLYQAKVVIDSKLRRSAGAYRIRVIHGYHGGTSLRDGIRKEYAKHPKVLRIELGLNPGETDLVLREF